MAWFKNLSPLQKSFLESSRMNRSRTTNMRLFHQSTIGFGCFPPSRKRFKREIGVLKTTVISGLPRLTQEEVPSTTASGLNSLRVTGNATTVIFLLPDKLYDVRLSKSPRLQQLERRYGSRSLEVEHPPFSDWNMSLLLPTGMAWYRLSSDSFPWVSFLDSRRSAEKCSAGETKSSLLISKLRFAPLRVLPGTRLAEFP